jgi:hypothetical protein
MKKFLSGVLLAGIVSTMSVCMAFADNKKDTIKFHVDVTVNGVLVKKGTYEVAFDEKTNEVAIMKGKEVIAKTTGRLEKRPKAARTTEYQTAEHNNADVLVSITFAGDKEEIVMGEGGTAGK